MARLSRIFLKVFGTDGPTDDFAKFGSRAAGLPVKTKDPVLIQSLDAWKNGHRAALLTGSRAPFLEDMNAADYVHSYVLGYLLQDGIPEWNTETIYFIGGIVKKPGTFELYGSLVDNNTGNALPDQTVNANWRFIGPQAEAPGIIKDFAGITAPSGYLFCDGAAISRVTFANLFTAIGTTWGVGNGTTTFNVPDSRGRLTVGAGGGPGLTNRNLADTGGAEVHQHFTPEHTHTIPSDSTGATLVNRVIINPSGQGPFPGNTRFMDDIGALSPQKSGQEHYHTHNHGGSTGPKDTNTANSSTMPPFVAFNKIIKI